MNTLDPAQVMQAVQDNATQSQLSNYSMFAQINCQFFCEQKTMKDAQDAVNSKSQDLTSESIIALESQCNKMCQRKFFKAFAY